MEPRKAPLANPVCWMVCANWKLLPWTVCMEFGPFWIAPFKKGDIMGAWEFVWVFMPVGEVQTIWGL